MIVVFCVLVLMILSFMAGMVVQFRAGWAWSKHQGVCHPDCVSGGEQKPPKKRWVNYE